MWTSTLLQADSCVRYVLCDFGYLLCLFVFFYKCFTNIVTYSYLQCDFYMHASAPYFVTAHFGLSLRY